MWDVFKTISEQVNLYSTLSGQLWYLCVFLFRMIVVASIGSQVYSDEQSAFRCSTKVIGCENVCYDKFAKISHIRFWSFQILALATPAVIFHFYTVYVNAKVEKLKILEAKAKEEEEASAAAQDRWDHVLSNVPGSTLAQRLQRKKRRIGKQKHKDVYNKDKLEEITLTRGIRLAYFCSVIVRIIVEIVFLVLAYDLFRFAEYPNVPNDGRIVSDGRRVGSIFDLFWIRVPQLYRCGGDSVRWACGQHMLPGNDNAYVPCWVSRPWEKTIFLRYMNTLGVLCLILCIIEMIHLIAKGAIGFGKKKRKKDEENPDYKKPVPTTEYYPPTSGYYGPQAAVESTQLKPAVSSPTIVSSLPVDTSPKQAPQPPAPKPVEEPPKMQQERAPETKDAAPAKKRWQEAHEKIEPRRRKSSGVRTRFLVPSGTQSLNRPRKVARTQYVPLYKMGKISFSESDGCDSDGGGDDGSSSEETQRESVSQHSDEADLV